MTYFNDASVSFRRVEQVPLTAGGKYIEYINEYGDGRASNLE
jgi:hypothetical protein